MAYRIETIFYHEGRTSILVSKVNKKEEPFEEGRDEYFISIEYVNTFDEVEMYVGIHKKVQSKIHKLFE